MTTLAKPKKKRITHTQERSNTRKGLSHAAKALGVQTKLKIGKPNDKHEQEADRVADHVVNGPKPTKVQRKRLEAGISHGVQKQADEEKEVAPKLIQKQEDNEELKPKLQRQTEVDEEVKPKLQLREEDKEISTKLIQKQEDKEELKPKLLLKPEEEEKVGPKLQRQPAEEDEVKTKLQLQEEEDKVPVQTKRSSTNQEVASPSIENSLRSSKGGGRPMSDETRSFMENRIGVDFSRVKIHNDSNAVRMNQELGAQAFAQGQNIYFNQGKYNPDSSSGKHLLAHELTHTVQQGNASAIQKQDDDSSSSKLSLGSGKQPFEGAFNKSLGSFTLDGFVTNKHDLTPKHTAIIKEKAATIAFLLSQDQDAYLVIEGHADAVGKEENNQTLSERRAGRVIAELINHGIPEHKMIKSGSGESELKIKTKKANAANRRVEVRFNKITMGFGVDTKLKLKDFSPEKLEEEMKKPNIHDLFKVPEPTKEQIEEWKWREMERIYKDLKPVDNKITFNKAVDGIIDKMTDGIKNKTIRNLVKKGIRKAIDKGIDAGLDGVLDQAGIKGEGKEAIKKTIETIREKGLEKHQDAN
ncbi:MAG: DUF4157 domain-containing protein [Reichenbachiella sp.]|uniref:eCIS core domain-containing protein n=1 Tax=Reichenbachiella sp. TaxID=2184521 RepID=UPI00326591F5